MGARGRTGDGHAEDQDVWQCAVGVDALGGPGAGALQGVCEAAWGAAGSQDQL